MISHVTVGADDISRAKRFWSAFLPALGFDLEAADNSQHPKGRYRQPTCSSCWRAPILRNTNVVLWFVVRYMKLMPRLSIDVTTEEHQKLKAIAALKGQSIKEYVLNRTLGEAPALDGMTEDEAFRALAAFLKPRVDQARRGELSDKSMNDIRREAREQAGL